MGSWECVLCGDGEINVLKCVGCAWLLSLDGRGDKLYGFAFLGTFRPV